MEFITSVINWTSTNWPEVTGAIVSIVGGFAIIARFTPNTSDDRIIQIILDGVNFLGMNNGKAKNDPNV